jgi:hypothetical protein
MKAKCAALLAGIFLLSATRAGALASAFLGVLVILGSNSPSYASTIVVNTFSTAENTTLVVSAPGVATGDTGTILFYEFGTPSVGSFSGLTTVNTLDAGSLTGSTDGSFTYVPPSNFTGTVYFIVQGVVSDPAFNPNSGSFNGTNALTDSIIIAAATPLPTALPLFATGLLALGLISWRRKRKAIAAA